MRVDGNVSCEFPSTRTKVDFVRVIVQPYFNFVNVFGKNYDLNYFALPRRETDVTPLYKVHRFNNTNSNAVYPGIPLIEMESLVGCELRFFCITFYPFSVFQIFYIQPRPKLVSLGGSELGIFCRPVFLTRRRGV